MIRHTCRERAHWKTLASEYGFHFHTIDGEPYWNESGYYQFSLEQIENHIEDPTAEIHQMCLQVVDQVVGPHAGRALVDRAEPDPACAQRDLPGRDP